MAPILILIISMFYKKDEQVGALPAVCECFRLINDVNLGSKDSVVLRHG